MMAITHTFLTGWLDRRCLFSSDWSLYTASSSVDSNGKAFRFQMARGGLESVYSVYQGEPSKVQSLRLKFVGLAQGRAERQQPKPWALSFVVSCCFLFLFQR